MENKYPEGTIVFAKTDPSHSLQVRRYAKRIYYCTDPANPLNRDQIYFERELMQAEANPVKS